MQELIKSLFPKMDPEAKTRWVKALRSGDFTQGSSGFLLETDDSSHDVFKFNCLGVLADINNSLSQSLGTDETWFFVENNQLTEHSGFLTDGAYGLPSEIQEFLFDLEDEFYNNPPLSFREIADFIEEYL